MTYNPATVHVPAVGRPHSAVTGEIRTASGRRLAALLGANGERPWLAGALALALLFAARTMAPAFGGAVQDDARQHVFWMLRYRDPGLFPGDLYADYFQSLSPAGYAALYRTLAPAIDPLTASALLPPLLGLVIAAFTFLFVRRLHPSPAAAFLAAVLASWYAWQYDDVPSATPRAFVLPTLAALLWALAAGRPALAAAATVVGALLYPIGGALGVALLGARLVRLSGRRPELSRRRADWLAAAAAAALVGLAVLPTVLAGSPYGPTVSAAEARAMPEFGESGRNAFFLASPYRFWLESYRSGLYLRPVDVGRLQVPIPLVYAVLAAPLPLLLAFRRRLPAARRVDGRAATILLQVLAVSFALYGLAHLLLFRLYLPARYVQWTVPLALAVAAGLVLAIVFEAIGARVRPAGRPALAAGLALLAALGLAAYPARYDPGFVRDHYPTITAYLRAQPKDTLVAAPPRTGDSLAVMSGRRVLVAREYAIAYHQGYYAEVRRRTTDLIDAYYDEGTRRLATLVERYGVDFFVVDPNAFVADRYTRAWTGGFEPFSSAVGARLDRPRRYALQDLARRCTVAEDNDVALVPATCLRASGR